MGNDGRYSRQELADLVTFMSRGPVVALVLESPEDTWDVVRTLIGVTVIAIVENGAVQELHIERTLERWPEAAGPIGFVQVGAPSRTRMRVTRRPPSALRR